MQRTIASIFYNPLDARRPYRPRTAEGGFLTPFHLDAAPRDGYTLLTVEDMDEWYKFSSEAPLTPMLIPGEQLAEDLVREWRDTMPGGEQARIGVFVCTDLDEVHPVSGKVLRPATEPSERELAQWRQTQTTSCEYLCLEAGDLYTNGKRKEIGIRHKDAAAWLGKSYPWMRPAEQTFTKPCPLCRHQIESDSIICGNCKTVINPAAKAEWEREAARVAAAISSAPADLPDGLTPVQAAMAASMAAENPR